MIIKTITCHHVYNYGSSLQTYALATFLNNEGHQANVIDYVPSYSLGRYNFWYLHPISRLAKIGRHSRFLFFLCCLWKNRKLKIFRTWGRKIKFDYFEKNIIPLTKEHYSNNEQLKNNPPKADVYIAGSDQIWNPTYGTGKDFALYLNFGDSSIKRIAYAASFGVSTISEDAQIKLKNYLKIFNAISVRETSGIKILNDLSINCCQVLDPVFLLSKTDWEKLFKPLKTTESYVLVYDFLHDDPDLDKMVQLIAQQKNLKIYSINDFTPIKYADKNINNAGPIEFLQYLSGASYVVCNSFHATAFSTILQKKFYTYPLRSQSNSSRMLDFLKLLNLESRYMSLTFDDSIIEWNEVQSLIDKYRDYAISFLNSSIVAP